MSKEEKQTVEPLPLLQLCSLNPFDPSDHERYCVSAYAALRQQNEHGVVGMTELPLKNETVTTTGRRKGFFWRIGVKKKKTIRKGKTQLLLHQCLQFHPSLSLVKAVYEDNPQALYESRPCYFGRETQDATPLHVAVYHNCPLPIVAFLVKAASEDKDGRDRREEIMVRQTSKSGHTPLAIAVRSKVSPDPELLKVLTANRAALSVTDGDGATPLLRAVRMQYNTEVIKILVEACPEEAVRIRLVQFGEKNDRRLPVSPFVHACGYSSPDIVSAFLHTIPAHLHRPNNKALLTACTQHRSFPTIMQLARQFPASIMDKNNKTGKSPFDIVMKNDPPRNDNLVCLLYSLATCTTVHAPTCKQADVSFAAMLGTTVGSDHKTIRKLTLSRNTPAAFLKSFLRALATNTTLLSLDMGDQRDTISACRQDSIRGLARALDRVFRKNRTLERLTISSRLLLLKYEAQGKSRLADLVSLVGGGSLKELTLDIGNSTFFASEFVLFALMKQATTTLEAFTVQVNPIIMDPTSSRVFINALLPMLSESTKLVRFQLSGVPQSFELISSVVTNPSRSLRSLTLDHCARGHFAADCLCSGIIGLLRNTPLETLSVVCNNLQETPHLKAILQALEKNTTLGALNYSGNGMSSEGRDILRQLVKRRNRTLHTFIHPSANVSRNDLLGFYLGRNTIGPPSTVMFMDKWSFVERLCRAKKSLVKDVHFVECAFSALRDAPHVWT